VSFTGSGLLRAQLFLFNGDGFFPTLCSLPEGFVLSDILLQEECLSLLLCSYFEKVEFYLKNEVSHKVFMVA
jgi:hypothetical protein